MMRRVEEVEFVGEEKRGPCACSARYNWLEDKNVLLRFFILAEGENESVSRYLN